MNVSSDYSASHLGVDVRDGSSQLVHDEPYRLPVHAPRLRLQQLKQVARHKLHHDEQPVAHKELVDELHDVGVLQRLEKRHLPLARALHVVGVRIVVLRLTSKGRAMNHRNARQG